MNAKIDSLVDSQIRLNEAQSLTDENVSRTDENLRNLIAVIDRYFREGRNGECGSFLLFRTQSKKRLLILSSLVAIISVHPN